MNEALPEPLVVLEPEGLARVTFQQPLPLQTAFRGLAKTISWSDPSLDLIEVAAAVLIADRRVRRTRQRPRRLHLTLPVRWPTLWRGVADDLALALSVLTGDRFTFDFLESRRSALPVDRQAGRGLTLERIALFSGGLDSACAAARFAAEGRAVGWVSQYSTGIRRLRMLLAQIEGAFGAPAEPRHACFYVRPRGPVVARLRENSRRSRSFLFTSLALAVAAGTGAAEVTVCENGPLALNLPMSEAMVATRHAHSQFLRSMERLASQLFDAPIRVLNPFELETKGEMARIFAPRPDLASSTVSCWYQQWAGRGENYGRGHCGCCIPCLVRLASLETARIAVVEGHFDVDVRVLARQKSLSISERGCLAAYHLLIGFARRLQGCRSWKSFLRSFPEAVESEPTSHVLPPDRWYAELHEMMRRFADEILAALDPA